MTSSQIEFAELHDLQECLAEMLSKGGRRCEISYWQGDKAILFHAPRTAVAGQMLNWVKHRLDLLKLIDPMLEKDFHDFHRASA